ncbi:MAG: hypothetical protein M1389_10405 [Chloroflexi bacterium]|nr:hypothetical protein [Chloroflexota bacterium]
MSSFIGAYPLAGLVVINVWSGRAAVSQWLPYHQGGWRLMEARNWEVLEARAVKEVVAQGGSITRAGHYICSNALARQALWNGS